MKESIGRMAVAVAVLAALVSACAPAPTPAPTTTPNPTDTPVPTTIPTATRTPKEEPTEKDLGGLITAEELSALSDDLGIAGWKPAEIETGAACRAFDGEGDMLTPIAMGNCILGTGGRTLPQVVQYLRENQSIRPSAVAIESAYEYEDDFALYRNFDERGYAVYDALLLREGLLYWAWIDYTTPIVTSPESLYEEYGEAIDSFLHEILIRNLQAGQ